VYFAGFAQDAAKYSCTIQLHKEDDHHGSITYVGEVIPMLVDPSIIEDERNGLIISDRIVRKLAADGKLRYAWSVNKI
jgi:hypothetical protein